jgi:2-hydroxy-6-oxonona-2,4-dienedioate hydrolase
MVSGLLWHFKVSAAPLQSTLLPIILIHGLGVSNRYLIPTAERLATQRTIYAPDLPGFGESDKPQSALHIAEMSDALAEWMSALEIERAVLLANSIGCQIVVDLAARRFELVERMVLVSPTVDPRARSVFRQFLRLLLDVPREPLSLMPIVFTDYLKAGLGRMAKTFAYAMQDRIEEKLPRVECPALVVRGARDPVVPQSWAEDVMRLLPRGRLAVIQGAAHAVNYNSPEKLASVVMDFLDSVF